MPLPLRSLPLAAVRFAVEVVEQHEHEEVLRHHDGRVHVLALVLAVRVHEDGDGVQAQEHELDLEGQKSGGLRVAPTT